MGRQKITISITDADFILWSKHYEACDSNMSKWISDVIHLALEKKLDAPMLRRDPDRVSVTARGLGAPLVQTVPPPAPPQVLDTRPKQPYVPPDPLVVTDRLPPKEGFHIVDGVYVEAGLTAPPLGVGTYKDEAGMHWFILVDDATGDWKRAWLRKTPG